MVTLYTLLGSLYNSECSFSVTTKPCASCRSYVRSSPLSFHRATPFTTVDWFQPWPREALFSVGRKFLSEMDLGSDGIRAAIEKFLPLSFKVVNTAAESFKVVERRWVMVLLLVFIAAGNAYSRERPKILRANTATEGILSTPIARWIFFSTVTLFFY